MRIDSSTIIYAIINGCQSQLIPEICICVKHTVLFHILLMAIQGGRYGCYPNFIDKWLVLERLSYNFPNATYFIFTEHTNKHRSHYNPKSLFLKTSLYCSQIWVPFESILQWSVFISLKLLWVNMLVIFLFCHLKPRPQEHGEGLSNQDCSYSEWQIWELNANFVMHIRE